MNATIVLKMRLLRSKITRVETSSFGEPFGPGKKYVDHNINLLIHKQNPRTIKSNFLPMHYIEPRN